MSVRHLRIWLASTCGWIYQRQLRAIYAEPVDDSFDSPQGQRSHITDAKPALLHGLRVFINIFARGTDLLEMDMKQPGIFDGSRWIN
jgi:hypothetical protein